MTPLVPRLLLATVLVALSPPVTAWAQARNARLSGAVVDKSSGSPLPGATVVVLGDGRIKTTDSTGVFLFDRLPSGIARFLVRHPAFPAGALIVALAPGEIMAHNVELDSTSVEAQRQARRDAAAQAAAQAPATRAANGQVLAPVLVEAERSRGPRFANFERRQKTGSGQYLVREQIEQGGFSTLQDIARSLRGVNVECSGGPNGCQIRMVRAPMRCFPEYVVDDNLDNVFGPLVSVRDIEAMEVYTGPADVPGEYAGRNAGCGVIVIWTRSGPPRKKK
ncbi:MAG: carboxypeptidase regulatory-like domain-containing protein [Gemmatimonadaceae bacterium]|nr:carboxypeptidase regulatory-like domain-containing protein [Gemmatimonadaceae bacterium]